MAIIRAAIHGAGYENLKRALSERLAFKTSGSLSGKAGPAYSLAGLNADERRQYEADVEGEGIAYVVMSYDTPIAWVTGAGRVHIVSQRFSVTTSRHQGVLHWLTS